jgi:hypothetical protein
VLRIPTPPNLMQSIPGPRVPAKRHPAPIILNETPASLPDPDVLPRGATPRHLDQGGGAVLSPGGMARRRPPPGGGGRPSVGPGLVQFLSGGGRPSVGPGLVQFLSGSGWVSLGLGGGVLPSPCLSGAGCPSVGPGLVQSLSGGG